MNYLESFEQAIIYMETHLDEHISVHEVAKISGYSYYHFTRVFQTLLGESIGNYIQKRRLSIASHKLLYSDRRMIDIALDSGFDSAEAFSRAFKQVYQVSPSMYRKNRLDVFLGNKVRLDKKVLQHMICGTSIQPQIKIIEEIQVAGIRGTASLEHLFTLWKQFGDKLDKIPHEPSARTFGICEYQKSEPVANYHMLFTEVIGVEVISCDNISEDIVYKIIPAGKYAVFTHRGGLNTILQTYQYIWGTWAVLTTESMDQRDDFEVYDERFKGREHEDSEIDIYIPIK